MCLKPLAVATWRVLEPTGEVGVSGLLPEGRLTGAEMLSFLAEVHLHYSLQYSTLVHCWLSNAFTLLLLSFASALVCICVTSVPT